MSNEKVLKVENVTMQFGGVIAVDNMNLEVNKGEIVSLIGPNGAGKTTAFNVITGVYAPTNGAVYYKGEKIIQNHPQGKMKKLYRGEHPSVQEPDCVRKHSDCKAPAADQQCDYGYLPPECERRSADARGGGRAAENRGSDRCA